MKGTQVFLNKIFVFQKICFKIKALKLFKISTGYHIKACRYLKRRAILKVPSTFKDSLEESLLFLLALK